MNVALSTLLLFIFLLPGIFFRRFYYSEQFSKEYFKQTIFEVFLSTFVPSLFIQTIWFYLIQLFNYEVDLAILGNLLSNPSPHTFKNIQGNSFQIVIYQITILVFSSLFGHYLQIFVRKYNLDRKYKIYRFRNGWHYLFTGEFFDFKRATSDLINNKPEEINYVFIDALVRTEEGTMIYEGMLVDYELSDKLGLETITLKEVRRRYLKDDFSDKELKHYEIPGHILVLKYSEIINLNLSYLKLDITEDNQILPVLIN